MAVDMGPIQIDKTEHHSVPLPPVLGVLAIVGGGALLDLGGRAAETASPLLSPYAAAGGMN